MSKNLSRPGFFKFSVYALLILTCLAALTPLWVSKDFLFPFITSKAFYLRIAVELGAPFFVYILLVEPSARPYWKNPLHISVLAFWLINILSAVFGIDSHKAIWGNFERMGGVFYLTHLILLYFYIVVLAKLEFKLLKIALFANIATAVGLSMYAIFVRLGMTPWVPDPSLPRVSATLGNPIFLPSYLIPIIFLTLFWGMRKTGAWRIYYFALVFIQLVAVFLSGTRGAVVGLIVGGFIAAVAGIVLSENRKLRTWGLGATIIVLLLGIGLYLNSNKLPRGTMLRRIFELRDTNTQARLIQWRVALSGFKDRAVLGTGAENYYVIGNKYFNPEIYQYDPSWFDKPHNYLLEVLVTNGVVGFAAYAAILVFCLWAFFSAWRWRAIGAATFSALLCGLLAYQIQNLFVFDTVSASMSFYIFVGFAAFLWEKILLPEESKNKKLAKAGWHAASGFALSAFSVCSLLCVYSVWFLNAEPLKASANTNYGYAYASVDPKKAEAFFQAAVNSPANFDLSETSSKYQEFAVGLLRNPQKEQPAFVQEVAQHSMAALESVLAQNPNNPIIWEKLAGLYLNYDFALKQNSGEKLDHALEQAVALAPKRTEAMSIMLQHSMIQGNAGKALEIVRQMAQLNPTSPDIQWQLSIILKQMGNDSEALGIVQKLYDKKYAFPTVDALSWLAQDARQRKDWGKLVSIYEQALKIDGQNKTLYLSLVEAYYLNGQKEQASALANRLIEVDASLKPVLEKYLQ